MKQTPKMQWAQKTITALRHGYEAGIAKLTEELRPRFESGELRGWRDGDADRPQPAPLWKLEAECRKFFCGTEDVEGGDDQSTYLALALTPSGADTYDGGATPEGNTGTAASWDVLRVALARGWWKPEKDEIPSAAKLGTLESAGWGRAA